MRRLAGVIAAFALAGIGAAPAWATTYGFDDFTRSVASGSSWGTPTVTPNTLPAPSTPTATSSSSGGTLGSGTYYYTVTSLNANGETTGSVEVSTAVTGPNGSVALSWTAVTGATSYRAYRGTSSGGQNTYYTSPGASFTDTGSSGTPGLAPTSNTTGNRWSEVHTTNGTSYSVNGYTGRGEIDLAAKRPRGQQLDVGQSSVEVTGNVQLTSQPTGGSGTSVQTLLFARADGTNSVSNAYMLLVKFIASSSTVTCALQKRVGGTSSTIAGPITLTSSYDWINRPLIHSKLYVSGSNSSAVQKGKCWLDGQDGSGFDPTLTLAPGANQEISSGTYAGARAVPSSTLSSAPTFSFDDFNAHDTDYGGIDYADPTIAAVGDIACRGTFGSSTFNGGNGTNQACQQRWTSNLICGTGTCTSTYAKVLGLGDMQYDCSDYEEFVGDSSESLNAGWAYAPGGSVNSWSRLETVPGLFAPVPGNHEYLLSGDSDAGSCSLAPTNTRGNCYFRYFDGGTGTGDAGSECSPGATGPANPDGSMVGGKPGGYYSYDIGTWKIVALNSGSNCGPDGPSCAAQTDWLTNVLETNTQPCVLAYWHHPRWSPDGNDRGVDAAHSIAAWWTKLVAKGADVVLDGHKHWSERYDKLDASGAASATGMREFIVGTGGKSHQTRNLAGGFSGVQDDEATFGILKLTLHPDSYDYQFIPSDSGGSPTNGPLGTPSKPESSTDPNTHSYTGTVRCNG